MTLCLRTAYIDSMLKMCKISYDILTPNVCKTRSTNVSHAHSIHLFPSVFGLNLNKMMAFDLLFSPFPRLLLSRLRFCIATRLQTCSFFFIMNFFSGVVKSLSVSHVYCSLPSEWNTRSYVLGCRVHKCIVLAFVWYISREGEDMASLSFVRWVEWKSARDAALIMVSLVAPLEP